MRLITDAPVDNHGLGRSFSPTDLLATATATCMMTIMAIVAERHGIDLSDSTFSVVKHMSASPPRRISRLDVTFRLPNVQAHDRERLESAAHTCPVHQSLHPDLVCDISFVWA